jgi:protein translocase SecG subunit
MAATGVDLDAMDDRELRDRIADIDVFARVAPEHKIRLVTALQSQGHVVAMTGDGVNDAPALKQADIGVAMGITGTEVTKEAATMVLTDDNFATIVAAVRQGRAIYDNIVKFVRFQLSTTLGFAIVFLLAATFGVADGKPFTAIAILWVNLIMDGPPAMALGLDPGSADSMRRRPRPRSERILTRSRWWAVAAAAGVMAVGTLAVLVPGPRAGATGRHGVGGRDHGVHHLRAVPDGEHPQRPQRRPLRLRPADPHQPLAVAGPGRRAGPAGPRGAPSDPAAALRHHVDHRDPVDGLRGGGLEHPVGRGDREAGPPPPGAVGGGRGRSRLIAGPGGHAGSVWGPRWAPDQAPQVPLRSDPSVLTALVVAIHVIVTLGLVFLVLLHSGKGGGLSDMFGGGVSATALGSAAAERNLDRITVVVALTFVFTTMGLAFLLD